MLALIAAQLAACETRAQHLVYTYPDWVTASVVGDVDRDGVDDFVAGSFGRLRLVSGRDSTRWRSFSVVEFALAAAPVGDLDGDGAAEVPIGFDHFATLYSGGSCRPFVQCGVHFQYSGPRHLRVTSLGGMADVDGDGLRDLLIAYHLPFALGLSAELHLLSGQTGTPIRTWRRSVARDEHVRAFGLGDIDADGRGDYAVVVDRPQSSRVELFCGASGNPIRSHLPSGDEFLEIIDAGGDFDGDQVVDYLLASRRLAGGAAVDLMSGVSGTRLRTWIGTSRAGRAGDVDGDGTTDLALGSTVYSGRTFAPIAHVPGAHALFGIGDRDGDGVGDLVAEAPRHVQVWSSRRSDLVGVPNVVGASRSSRQDWWFQAPAAHAGKPFLVLGTVSGTTPGIQVAGAHLPLNFDPYTILTGTGQQLFVRASTGLLSASATAAGGLDLPAVPGTLFGLTLHHVYAVLGTGVDYVSQPVPLLLVF